MSDQDWSFRTCQRCGFRYQTADPHQCWCDECGENVADDDWCDSCSTFVTWPRAEGA